MTVHDTLAQTLLNTSRKHLPNGMANWEELEKVAREYLLNELYTAASDLFDPNTVLNIEKDEYQRGVAELITRFAGMDDKDDVANIISEGTGIYRLTVKDFGTGLNGDLLYIGPLEVAQDFMRKHDNTVKVERVDYSLKLWRVELADGNSYGVADTVEMAWRYALAAEFGPIDEEFSPFLLD